METIDVNKIIVVVIGWLVVCTVIHELHTTPFVSATIGMLYIPIITYIYGFIRGLIE